MDERIYGLLGRKLGHSWSVPIHAALGNGAYRLLELEPDGLAPFLHRKDIGGLNVTIPYKRDVMPLCDEIDPAAEAIGSVNTIVRCADGKLVGYNTDIDGFLYMACRAGISLSGKKVVILGSGGASLTAQTAARQGGAAEVVVVSRFGPDNYDNLSRHADAEILVNATPVGMYPGNGQSPVDLSVFPVCQGVLDVIYNPRRTALLLQAEARSIPCSDGLPMLVAQAVAAEERFFNRSIPAGENERILVQLRREMTNLILIGMPGSGKTTVGEALSRAHRPRGHGSWTQMIETTAGCSIPGDLRQREGESGFRALGAGRRGRRLGSATGSHPPHRRRYHQDGGKLRGPPSERPHLSAGAGSAACCPPRAGPCPRGRIWPPCGRERAPLYARFRDVEIDNSGTVEDTAAAIWRDFCAHSGS